MAYNVLAGHTLFKGVMDMIKLRRRIAIPVLVLILLIATQLTQTRREHDSIPAVGERSPGITLIIDPGHGGADGGARSPGGLRESEVNLDIALRLDLLMGLFGVRTIMTRDSEDITYSAEATTFRAKKNEDLRRVTTLANSTENAVFISIHQNMYTAPEPFGAQVLFARTAGSREFAESMQKLMISALNPENYRPAAAVPGRVFIMNNIKHPAILIECGFFSNPDEEALLKTDEYRLKIATVIAAGFMQNKNLIEDVVVR